MGRLKYFNYLGLETQRTGIPVLIDNPAVGANLIDHPSLPNIFNVKDSLETLLRDLSRLEAAINQRTVNKTGIHSGNRWRECVRLASGRRSPHWEILPAVTIRFRVALWVVLTLLIGFWEEPLPPTRTFMSLLTILLNPTSRKLLEQFSEMCY